MSDQIMPAALAVARRVGYRNVSRQLVLEELQARGQAPTDEKAYKWSVNHIHPVKLREQLARVPGLPEGEKTGSTSSAWAEKNKADILDAAYELAELHGFMVSKAKIAERAKVSMGTVNLRWGTMQVLRAAVLQRARERGNYRLITQAEAVGFTA